MILLVRTIGLGAVVWMATGAALCAGVTGSSHSGPRSAKGMGSPGSTGPVGGTGTAGIASQLKDVPFRATQVIVRRGSDGVIETRGGMARNSAGSTYVELIDERTKRPAEVLIFDVPNHRELVLDVQNRRYRMMAAPALECKEAPLDHLAEQLRVAAMEKNSSVRRVKDGVEWTWKGLGVRRVAGLETVGNVKVRRPLAAPGEAIDGPAEVDESWISVDLGIAVLRTRHDPLRGEDTEVALTEILRVEPEARLFQVPPGYVLDGGDAELVRPAIR